MIIRRGLITGPAALLDILPVAAFKVTSWDNSHSPKTQQRVWDRCHAVGARAESIFDAAHGHRYMLFVYRSREERKACWDFHTGSVS